LKDEISNNCQSFYVHVNNDKNDFYVWVDDLIDKNLAKKIKDLKTPQDFLLEISLEITK
jgi:hypothetical protein